MERLELSGRYATWRTDRIIQDASSRREEGPVPLPSRLFFFSSFPSWEIILCYLLPAMCIISWNQFCRYYLFSQVFQYLPLFPQSTFILKPQLCEEDDLRPQHSSSPPALPRRCAFPPMSEHDSRKPPYFCFLNKKMQLLMYVSDERGS